jgi:hypothetical protein
MSDCPIYLVTPGTEAVPSPVEDAPTCKGCNCGYIQYEALIPYLAEIRDSLGMSPDKAIDLEFKLREQILEISRLFDMDAGVEQGYFSKAHTCTTKRTVSSGKYMKIPPHIEGTLEVRTMDDILLDSSLYTYKDGHLIYQPCEEHIKCGCSDSCGNNRVTYEAPWPDKCYKVRAKWGSECSEMAVQMAVRDYLIERYRMQDPVVQSATGITFQRKFAVPHSWSTFIRNFKEKRKIFSNFAVC